MPDHTHLRNGKLVLFAWILGLAWGCGGGGDSSSTPGPDTVHPVISNMTLGAQGSTLIVVGQNFGTKQIGCSILIDGVDVTPKSNWTDGQIVVPLLPDSGKGSSGDVQVGAVKSGALFYSNTLQLSEWRGTITVTNKDLINYVGEQTVGTYNVHFRACVNNFLSKDGIGAQAVKDSTCSCDASGTFSGPDYVEKISRNGDPMVPISYTAPDIHRLFDSAITFGTANVGDGSAAHPIDYSKATILFDSTATDLNGIDAIRLNKKDGSSSTYTKIFSNAGLTPAIPGYVDGSISILAGTWTSTDGSIIVSWTAMPIVHGPKFVP